MLRVSSRSRRRNVSIGILAVSVLCLLAFLVRFDGLGFRNSAEDGSAEEGDDSDVAIVDLAAADEYEEEFKIFGELSEREV